MMFQLEMTVRCEPSRAAAATSQPPAAASSRLYGCLPAPRPRPHLAHPSWPALTASITMRCHAASGGLLRLAPTGASALARTNARARRGTCSATPSTASRCSRRSPAPSARPPPTPGPRASSPPRSSTATCRSASRGRCRSPTAVTAAVAVTTVTAVVAVTADSRPRVCSVAAVAPLSPVQLLSSSSRRRPRSWAPGHCRGATVTGWPPGQSLVAGSRLGTDRLGTGAGVFPVRPMPALGPSEGEGRGGGRSKETG